MVSQSRFSKMVVRKIVSFSSFLLLSLAHSIHHMIGAVIPSHSSTKENSQQLCTVTLNPEVRISLWAQPHLMYVYHLLLRRL